jgi:hypothetical protein
MICYRGKLHHRGGQPGRLRQGDLDPSQIGRDGKHAVDQRPAKACSSADFGDLGIRQTQPEPELQSLLGHGVFA